MFFVKKSIILNFLNNTIQLFFHNIVGDLKTNATHLIFFNFFLYLLYILHITENLVYAFFFKSPEVSQKSC